MEALPPRSGEPFENNWEEKPRTVEGRTRCPSWHELPKSTILMAERLGLQRRMFSGLRSQWMMDSSGVDRKSSAVQSCCANLRVRFSETPRKLVLRSRSYRLYDSSSNTRHRWLRHIKCRFKRTANKNNDKPKRVLVPFRSRRFRHSCRIGPLGSD